MDDDLVFRALADPTRRLLLDRLFERDGRTLGELEAEVPGLTRFGVMMHLRTLEQAGLVVTRKVGRFKHHHLNPVPIRLIHERWIDKYRGTRVMALLDLKDHIEGTAMTTTETAAHVYQLYIKASPERIWEAITDPGLVLRFFGAVQESTFEVGTPLRNWSPDHSKLWSDNVVLECDPPRRLVHTWRSLYNEEAAAEPESRVTWEIEPHEGGFCKLTFTHDRLESSPHTARVTAGWPYILSSLKSLIETGEPLPPRFR